MRPPRLRRVLAISTGLIAAGALFLAAALIIMTSRLERASEELAAAVQSVRIAQQAELELLLLARDADPVVARSHAADLRAALRAAAPHVRSSAEAETLDRAVAETERYLAARGRGEPAAEAYEAAFAAIADLVAINTADARAARVNSERWSDEADVIGWFAIVVFAAISIGFTLWIRRALRPMLSLSATLERFSSGEHTVRAEVTGPVELRQMARQFNQMAEALDAQVAARTTLLRSIAHDLRSPLSAVRLSAEAFAADRPLPPEPQIRAGLARISRGLDRVDRLISDLTDLAQIESGKLRVQLERCDAVEIVRDVVGLYEAHTRDRSIVVSSNRPAAPVDADPSRLEQVVGNLLTNAVKYSPRETPIAVAVDASDDQTTITVADRGPGIRPEERELLFQPYWRGRVGDVPGSGLGLFITRQIVEAHGGTIDVAEGAQGGSVFRVRLPTAAA